MRFGTRDRWVVLRHKWRDGEFFFEYEDDRKRRRRADDSTTTWDRIAFPHSSDLHLPHDLPKLLRQAADESRTPDGGPGSLPIFVQWVASWTGYASWLGAALETLKGEEYQLVRLPAREWARPATLTLPIKVAIVGDDAAGIAQVLEAAWWMQDFVARRFGIQIEQIPSHRVAHAYGADIVIANEVDGFAFLEATPKTPFRRPPFVIVYGTHDDSDVARFCNDAEIRADQLEKKWLSLVWLPPSVDPAAAVESLLLSIVHDMPLHQAVAALPVPPGTSLPFVSDPIANQSLRVSDAFEAAMRDALDQEIAMPSEGLASGLATTLDELLEGHSDRASARRSAASAVHIALEMFPRGSGGEPESVRPLDLRADFSMERRGLVPISYALQSTESQRQFTELRGRRGSTPLDLLAEDEWAALAAAQKRHVDARLERVEHVPISQLSRPAVEAIWVASDCSLAAGQRYRLRVQIGGHLRGNLIKSTRPSIDRLLPRLSPQGYDLEVALFPKDFTAAGRRVVPLRLPFAGASQAVYLDLRAPRRLGTAKLRFGVYYENQLLQSFVLEAPITPVEETLDDTVLRVRIDFSRTLRFQNLNQLRKRALSIGVNRDAEGTHSLLVKSTGEAHGFSFEANTLRKPLETYRAVLAGATKDKNDNPVFSIDGKARTAAEAIAFEQAIRDFARVGSDLHDALFIRNKKKLGKVLQDLRKKEDQTLQFTRFDPNYVVPWTVMYDYDLPPHEVVGRPAAVCVGTDARGGSCGHGPISTPVYCAKGFWGIRHRVEEQFAFGEGEAVPSVDKPANPLVRLAAAPGDRFTAELRDGLRNDLGAADGCADVEQTDDVFDLLWKKPRPAMFIVVAHMAANDVAGEPAGRRIDLPGLTKFLLAKEITAHLKNDGEWAQPNTIVMLMACNAVQTDDLTLNDHVTALAAAGAAAVIGPEAPVFSGFACRFAREVATDMLVHDKSIGEAVTAFRRNLIRSGNPLAFVFSAFGDADLVVK